MRWLWLVALLASCDWVFRLDEVTFDPDPDALPPGSGRWKRVATGSSHTCALDVGNRLFCWGRNVDGEAGRATEDTMLAAPGAVDTGTWTKVATSAATTCGIREGGALFCWGHNDVGQVGDGGEDDRTAPVPIGSGVWTDVSIGLGHGCAVKEDHTVWCWGLNESGELGNGLIGKPSAPTPVSGATTFRAVSVGDDTTCAIADDNSLYCWGDNDNDVFGTSTPAQSSTPLAIAGETWSHIAIGHNFGCGITTGGDVRCWGRNKAGQVGDGTQVDRSSPTPVALPLELTWVQIVANERNACARSENGRVFCWGDSTMGQLTVADDVAMPTEIQGMSAGVTAWRDVATGHGHTCFVSADYHMYCAGKNGFSQLADGGSSSNVPVLVPGGTKWRDVTTGKGFTCAVDTDFKVKCAGRNQLGQLGTGNTTWAMTMTPTAGVTLDGTVKLAAGLEHACAHNGNSIYCWGGNYNYQLGLGDDNDRTAPTFVRAGNSPTANMHSCLIDNTNTRLYCWGSNERLQINATGVDVQTPFDVSSGQQFKAIAAGSGHTCAIETGGALYCMGDRYQLGITDPGAHSATMQFTGRTGMATVSAGSHHTCATTTGNVGYCWGLGYAGQLGVGTNVRNATPVLVPGNWTLFAGGEAHTCGIQLDQSLHCFGENMYGQLGLPTGQDANMPQLVSPGPWRTVAAAELHTCAINGSNDLYCWGNNDDGELANGMAWRAKLQEIP